jgi:hypothetical protein
MANQNRSQDRAANVSIPENKPQIPSGDEKDQAEKDKLNEQEALNKTNQETKNKAGLSSGGNTDSQHSKGDSQQGLVNQEKSQTSGKKSETLPDLQRSSNSSSKVPGCIWIALPVCVGLFIVFLISSLTNSESSNRNSGKNPISAGVLPVEIGARKPSLSQDKGIADLNPVAWRKWTNSEGQVIQAAFEGHDGVDFILLRLPTGILYRYPVEKLSAISRQLAARNGVSEFLSWTNSEGKTIQASFEGFEGIGNVLLGSNTGIIHKYPLENLSKESQEQALRLIALTDALDNKLVR